MPPEPTPEMILYADELTSALAGLKEVLRRTAVWIKENNPGAPEAECEAQLWAIVATGARFAFGHEFDTARILGDIGGLLGEIGAEMQGMASSAN